MNLEEVNKQLEEETRLWIDKCGGVPGQVIMLDTFLIGCHIEALVDHLVELGVVEREAFELGMKEHLLDVMRKRRKDVEAARRQALMDRLVPPMGLPRDMRKMN